MPKSQLDVRVHPPVYVLGALIIGAIANGMDLLAFASSVRFMITGAVLLLAVTLDAYTRARREQIGE